jgi:hypothetical protein
VAHLGWNLALVGDEKRTSHSRVRAEDPVDLSGRR